jgi:type IV fimbrial biogenesis protein FimT
MENSERCRRTTGRGFTFIEIMIALVIFGLLLTTAVPAYRDWIAAQELANHAHFIADTLDIAGSEAIKHGYRVNLCKTRDRRPCSDVGGWEQGWLLFVDPNRSGQVEDDTIVVRREGPAADGITMHGNRPSKTMFPIPVSGMPGFSAVRFR